MAKFHFQDQHYLITGAAGGIGLATARFLHYQGARLSLWDWNEAALKAASKVFGDRGDTAVVDVTQLDQIEAGLAQADGRYGPIHGLIHCAGILTTGRFNQLDSTLARRMVDVNLTGSVLAARAAAPYLRRTHGSLVLIASTAAFYGSPEFGVYSATKAGVLSLGQTLRLEWEADGVHVGVVCPFFVSTPMLEEGIGTRLFARFGVGHTPEEVADAILKGIEKRRFMIWPGWRPNFFHWLSHASYPVGHWLMRWFWRE